MSAVFDYYHSGSLKWAAAAAVVSLASSDASASMISKILLASVCAAAAYALSYPFCSDPCVYYARKHYPLDDSEFKSAYNQAFNRLVQEGFIHYVWSEQDEREHFYRIALKGICFGQAALFLRMSNKNPHLSSAQVAASIDLAEVIYLQLRNRIERRSYIQAKEPCYSEDKWFPVDAERDLSFAVPWQEKVFVLYEPPIEEEGSWIKFFSSIAQTSDFKGRVSFATSSTSEHTFAFWHSGNRFSYYDAGNVYEFLDRKAFCKSVRNEILRYRREEKKRERQINKYSPVTVRIIKGDGSITTVSEQGQQKPGSEHVEMKSAV